MLRALREKIIQVSLARNSHGGEFDNKEVVSRTAKLRAERSGLTSSRIYTITIEATDVSGNVSQPKTVIVTVPHSKGGK